MKRTPLSDSVRQQLAFKVFQAFNDLLLAEANRDVVRETHQQRIKHLEQARSRFNNGVATEIDVLRSEVNVANMEPDLIRADNRVRLARAAINNLIVADLEAPTQIAGSLEYRPWPAGSLEEIQKRTLELRPELQAARRQLQQARLTISLANAENKLTLDLEGQWGYAVREPKNIFNNDFSRWNLTFNFKLPLFDSGRKSGLIVQALARLRAAEQRLAQLENEYPAGSQAGLRRHAVLGKGDCGGKAERQSGGEGAHNDAGKLSIWRGNNAGCTGFANGPCRSPELADRRHIRI